jgi:hypothetical protein
MSPLADYLARFDYATLPLRRAATGHLQLERAAIDGRDVTLYLDTGAGRTVFDAAKARDLGLALEPDGRNAGGAGAAALASFRTRLARFELGEIVETDFAAAAIDLAHVNAALRARGERPMDGVLGADILDAREAVIDYRQLCLFLKRSVRPRTAAA